MEWKNTGNIHSNVYRCGYCGERVSSSIGYFSSDSNYRIYICPNCNRPTYFERDKQFPSFHFGNDVKNVPDDIADLYNEARRCTSVQAFTASVMACRKLLMNIAVEKGAEEGLSFQQYVEYLNAKHYIPPNGKDWVDHIREKGNEANHEIKIMEKENTQELITFIEMLLKFIYEFPSKIKREQTE